VPGRSHRLAADVGARDAPGWDQEDVTSDPSTRWTSDNTNTATVDPKGVVVGVNAGITTITATYQGASGDVKCTVGP